MIICPICKKECKQLTYQHIKKHDITIEEFKNNYPNVYLGNDNSNITKAEIKKQNVIKDDVRCLQCNNLIDAIDRKRRKFCSHTCSALYNNIRKEKKNHKCICLNCKTEFITLDVRKKYCNHKCQWDYLYKDYIQKWLNGEITGLQCGKNSPEALSSRIKKYLIETRGQKCEECGWDKINLFSQKTTLQIHHIDGDSRNCKIENLQILCPNCHSLTKYFGGLNRGNGRKGRYKKLL